MKKIVYWIVALLLLLGVLAFTMFGNNAPEVEEPQNSTAATTVDPTEHTESGDIEIATIPAVSEEEYEAEFVPSVTYKGGPAAITSILDGKDVSGCVVVTTIAEALEKSTDITQGERDTLVEVYEKLVDGTMTLPIDGEYMIREFVDVSFKDQNCRQQEDHGEKDEELAEVEIILTTKFEYDIDPTENLVVMAYVDGEWIDVATEINDDGTITCAFEQVCPVAFIVLK